MSAPRKIWAHGLCMGASGKASTSVASYRHGRWETRHGDTNYASLYHHDDVVRELVEVLEAIRQNDRQYAPRYEDSDCGAGRFRVNRFVGYGQFGKIADAALAKIAQEG